MVYEWFMALALYDTALSQDAASRALLSAPPTRPHPLGLHRVAQHPAPQNAMSAETGHLLSDASATFAARLDALCTDQNPEDLSNALRAAFKERELYNLYVFSSVGDTGRAQALLEVFDKVRSVKCAVP